MSEPVVLCPACGARNSPTASWCTQCFTALGEPDTPASAEGATTPTSPSRPPARDADPAAPFAGGASVSPPTGGGASVSPPAGGGAPPAAGERAVRERDGEVEWRCSRCGRWSPLGAPTCAGCGAPRTGFGPGEPARRPSSPEVVVGASVLVPGAGHVLGGRAGTGVSRALLWAVWLIGGVAGLWGTPAGSTNLPGGVLLGGALLLWAATLVDARDVAAGGSGTQVLTSRRLLVLVTMVTTLAVLSLLLAVMSGR